MPDRSTLTARQLKILTYLEAHIAAHGYPPTRREICAAFGFASVNGADAHLRALARKGVVRLDRLAARGIALLDSDARPSLRIYRPEGAA